MKNIIKILTLLLLMYSCSSSDLTIHDYSYQVKKFNEIPNWETFTLKEKIGQMIMVRVSGKFYNNPSYNYNNIKQLITEDKVGGVIMFYADIHGAFHNINLFQNWSEVPLLIGSDYERGLGQWMDGATLFPSNMAIAATGNPFNAYLQGKIIGKEAKSLGVHIAFAPVLDINNNPLNPIINLRSYGDNPQIVSEYGINFLKGIQSQGVSACGKHFPGHGDTDTDSHSSLPIINSTKDKLNKNEIYPFKTAIQDSIRMIMIGHLVVPSLDSSHRPATHSYSITTNLLKNELGFNGLVITDGMEMGALSKNISNEESAIRAIEAGADIILLPIDVDNAIKAIENAVKEGRISEERINHSVKKIWELKKDAELFNGRGFPNWSNIEKLVGSNDHKRDARRIASQSITLVKDGKNSIPIKPEKINKLSHVIISTDDSVKDYLGSFSKDIIRTVDNVDEIFINYKLDNYLIDKIIDKLLDSDLILISSLVRIRADKGISTIDSSHLDFLKKLKEKTEIPILFVSFGSPYIDSYDYFDAYIATYGYGPVSVKAAANAIFGRENISGKLPIDLNSLYIKGTGLKRSKRVSEFKKKVNNNYNLESAFAVIDSAIENKIFPGAQIFISKNEDIISHIGVGSYTYKENSINVDTASIYDIASITKVISTLPLTMKLIEKRRLSINNYVKEYYPEFKGPYKDEVKIKHLLTHSSGIKGYVEYFKQNDIFNNETAILNDILARDLEFQPGTRFEYSDLGMILLKNIIEKTNRSKFDKLASSWIYRPLNMRNTYFNPNPNTKNKVVPTEYDSIYRNRIIVGEVHDENAYLIGGVSGHAGIFSNAWDIAIFSKLFLNDGVWLGKRHFSKSTIRKFINKQNIPHGSDRALGWDTPSLSGSSAGDFFSKKSFGHLGFTGTSVWVDKKNDIIIILLTNRVHPSREKDGIYGIRREFHNKVMAAILN